MPKMYISLFGRFTVREDEQVLNGFEARKVQELFSYLILNRNRPHPRETLAEVLWPDNPDGQAKKALRQTLWQLQAALGQADSPVLLVEPEWIQLNPETGLWLDVAVFEEVFSTVQGVPGHELGKEKAEELEHTIRLYQGALLDGWYQDWCLYERERFHSMYLSMLDKLMDYCEARQDYESGLIYGLRIMCHDRARERTHRRLMRMHYLAGDRVEALRQYQRCVTALEEELGVKPSRRTIMLYDQIRADQLIASSLAVQEPELSIETIKPLELMNHLQQLQLVLGEMQRLLQQDLDSLQTVLTPRLNEALHPSALPAGAT